MPTALFRLIFLQSRGLLRRTISGARSPRRAVFLVIGFGVLVLWLAPALVTRIAVHHDLRRSAESIHAPEDRPAGPPGSMPLTIISSAGDKAIAFTPGEVDMLFPGPFTRRQLLTFKIVKSALAALITALTLSIGLMPYPNPGSPATPAHTCDAAVRSN